MQRVELRHLSKRFGRVAAVDDLNLVIEPASFLTFLGPSGCGKTTVLRMIAGLEEPDTGEIVIGDRTVFSSAKGILIPPSRRGLGMVFQSYALWPHMTVFQNVAFGLELAHWPRKRIGDRVGQVMSDLQLTGLEGRYPQEMSGGQQQRVALARMLALQPGIFLLDEPLSNLDARLRVDMRSELKRLHRETGATVIYVTHDQLEALTMSTHVAVIRDGRLVQLAPPEVVYRQPATLFVADFVGSPKNNLLKATVRGGTTASTLDFGSFSIPFPGIVAQNPVIVAIRPESMGLSLDPVPGAIEFRVYASLPAGAEQIVNAKRDNVLLTIRETRPLRMVTDRPIWVSFDPNTFSLYDPVSARLLNGTENLTPPLPAGQSE